MHALNAPAIVFDFIDSLPPGSGKRTFIIKSPADPFFRGGSSHLVIRALANRGYRVFHESMIVMPANVFIRYPDDFIRELVRTAERRAGETADEIIAGLPRRETPGFLSRLCTRFFSSLEVRGGRYFGRDLRVSSECTLCEKCIRECPRGNIFLRDGRIVFGKRCMICMRCLYGCPQNAISPRFFSFFKVKRWYNLATLAADAPSGGGYVPNVRGGFFRLFSGYLGGRRKTGGNGYKPPGRDGQEQSESDY